MPVSTHKDRSHSETQTTFNGILHYETWAVTKWIESSPAAAGHWTQVAIDTYHQCEKGGDPVMKLAELLEQRHVSMVPVKFGLYADLLNATLRRVNWREVAVALLAKVPA